MAKKLTNSDIQYNADGTVVMTALDNPVAIEPDADGMWSYTFYDLPQYRLDAESGEAVEIVYTVKETPVDDYDTDELGLDVMNTHDIVLTEVSGVKTWLDDSNRDGVRPASIEITLLADGEPVTEVLELSEEGSVQYLPDGSLVTTELENPVTVEPDEDGSWAYAFTGLPKYRDGGEEIIYTLVETPVDDYTTEADGYDFINTHEVALTEAAITKTWIDDDDRDGVRPASIVVTLLADGEIVTEVPELDENGVVQYQANGALVMTTLTNPVTIEPDEDGAWSYTFYDLPQYRYDEEAGKAVEIVYTIEEKPVDAYDTDVQGFHVKNTHDIALTEVGVTKTWQDDDDRDGVRPASIEVTLLADGEIVTEVPELSEEGCVQYLPDGSLVTMELENPVTVKPDENGDWAYTFNGLPKYRDGGTAIVYTVKEAAVDGYETEINGFDITNTYEIETVKVSGVKTWADDDNHDGLRPDSITINLLADGEKIKSTKVKADADGVWSYTFTNLPKYRDHGVRINYTVTEDEVPAYTAEVKGYDVTNSHENERISVTMHKIWVDGNNIDGLRGDYTVQLYADGEPYGDPVTLDRKTREYTWTNLLKYDAGREVVYTVVETKVPEGYTASYSADGLTITNTHPFEYPEFPQTGDDSNKALYLGMALALLLAGCGILLVWRRKKSQ